VDLGRRIGHGLITDIPELVLNKMELLEARSDTALLSGQEEKTESEPYKFFSRSNLAIWVPFISAAFLAKWKFNPASY
jgi:hypothetical protein